MDVADLATLASCTILTGAMLPFTVLHLRLVALLPIQEICCQLQHGDRHWVTIYNIHECSFIVKCDKASDVPPIALFTRLWYHVYLHFLTSSHPPIHTPTHPHTYTPTHLHTSSAVRSHWEISSLKRRGTLFWSWSYLFSPPPSQTLPLSQHCPTSMSSPQLWIHSQLNWQSIGLVLACLCVYMLHWI